MSNEFLKKINTIIKEERGSQVVLEDTLIKAELDSFSWIMFWLELDKLYPKAFSEEFVSSQDYKKVKFCDLEKMI